MSIGLDDGREQPDQRQLPSPFVAMQSFWSKAFTYSGRANRSEYNWALLMCLLVTSVAGIALTPTAEDSVVRLYVGGLLGLAFIVPWIALVVRRCHDINRRGAFGLWLLATGIGFLITEGILMLGDSDPRGSRFD
jgi:uncharacterized membrane protein YhaH (DUF805 family)